MHALRDRFPIRHSRQLSINAGTSLELFPRYHGGVIGGPDHIAAPVRWAYLGAGGAFVGLGVLGTVLPLLPSTIFFILALWAFKRSSPRLEQKMLQHPVIGRTLQDWEATGAVRRRTKILAISLIWICLSISAILVQRPVTTAILAAVGLGLTAYLVTRPEPA